VKLAAGPFTYGKTVDKTKTDDETFSETHSRTHLEDASDTSLSSESGQLLYDRNHIPMQETPTYTLYDLNADGIYDPDAGEVVITRPASFTEKTSSEASRENSDTYNTSQSTTHDVVDSFAKNITEQQAAVLSADALELVISALKKTDGVSMLSNPKIIVSSGSTNAYFSFGGREPIIKTEIKTGTQDSPGDTLTAQLSTDITTDYIKQGYLETGVRLSVIPVVKTEDLIEATIRPKLVRKNGDKTIGVNSWPILFVKEIETKFTLRSGQTVAIGGLTDTQDEKHVAKVPLLGDIPLIGKYLFSHTQDIKGQKETIIFVSLTLAEPEKIAPNVGIPEASELVHKRMIQDETHRKEFKANIRQLQEAAAAEQQQLAEKEKKAAEKAAAARAASKAK
jgi:type II secretory pathway component GspD/PulD (secretin)